VQASVYFVSWLAEEVASGPVAGLCGRVNKADTRPKDSSRYFLRGSSASLT
jgi:hypothetical protein